MSGTQRNTPASKVFIHVDMDGLDAIYQAYDRKFSRDRDDFYLSAVDNSLAFFESEGIEATYFLIAANLKDASKRAAVQRVIQAGHHVASHGLNHLYLNKIPEELKREEIFSSKKRIEDDLGVECLGFRAPGYSIDYRSLELLREAGYRYDSSIFPVYEFKQRLGLERLFTEPFEVLPGLVEFPMPTIGPGMPPFHPCYAFYLGRYYYRFALSRFHRRNNYLTLLFHLTDFANRQPIQGFKLNLFANNFFSARSKLRFLHTLAKPLKENFSYSVADHLVKGWPDSAPDLNPRTILGISTTHETGACIVRDGEVLSAINEERLSRRKLDSRYPPVGSIKEAIRISEVSPQEIDAVAIAGLHWKDLLPRMRDSFSRDFRDYHGLSDYFPHFCRILYRGFYLWRATRYDKVLRHLKDEYGISPKPFYIEHQEAHASCAFRTGSARQALVVTADGVGDELTLTVSAADGSVIRRLASLYYPHSFGHFYTSCTQILGFRGGRHEGKITGLSGFGEADPDLIRKVKDTTSEVDGFQLNKRYYVEGGLRMNRMVIGRLLKGEPALFALEYRNYKMPLKRLLKGYPRENVAYAFQHLLELQMVNLLRPFTQNQPVDLALAGGVFANVKLNMALGRDLSVRSLHVFPNMGDGGLCIGAALSITAPAPVPMAHMYLGTSFPDSDIEAVLMQDTTVGYVRPDKIAEAVARALADQRIVARFDGPMEFGPRALGNRSILYHCGDRSVNDWLNYQLCRTEFMPFAPICLAEDADEYFVIPEGQRRPTEFMTLVVRCTDKMQRLCPAAVHIDGTARPQLVSRETNPGMHKILAEYKRLTGVACVINTSFNMHEEPIVRTPKEALSAFRQSQLHHLAIGSFLVSQNAAATRVEQSVAASNLHPASPLVRSAS